MTRRKLLSSGAFAALTPAQREIALWERQDQLEERVTAVEAKADAAHARTDEIDGKLLKIMGTLGEPPNPATEFVGTGMAGAISRDIARREARWHVMKLVMGVVSGAAGVVGLIWVVVQLISKVVK